MSNRRTAPPHPPPDQTQEPEFEFELRSKRLSLPTGLWQWIDRESRKLDMSTDSFVASVLECVRDEEILEDLEMPSRPLYPAIRGSVYKKLA